MIRGRVSSDQVRVGNDVIDLGAPRCQGRSLDDRLADRILSSSEKESLAEADGDALWPVRLWSLWAAKETAYKIRCKLGDGAGPFRPQTFEVVVELDASPGDRSIQISGSVRSPDLPGLVSLTGASNGRHLHLVGWSGDPQEPRGARLERGLEQLEEANGSGPDELRDRFTDEEWAGIYSRPSAVVRLLARKRLESLLSTAETPNGNGERPGRRVEILTSGEHPARTPPRIRISGQDVDAWDVSLSHHGRYVAWALLVPG